MKTSFLLRTFILVVLVSSYSCSPPIELSSSWTNKSTATKATPKIMVMAFGKTLSGRQLAENQLKEQFVKRGYNTIASLDIFAPNQQKIDSLALLETLRKNNIDMVLTNAVTNISEQERYVEGATYAVPVGAVTYPSYSAYYGGLYNYYGYRYMSYQPVYETRTDPGYTVIDVEVSIESNLYDVTTTNLLWVGQSKSYTKEPSIELANEFARLVVDDLEKNKLIHH